MPRALFWEDGRLVLLDQRQLPNHTVYMECSSVECVAEAIECLAVRGAPAIGIAAAFGTALAAAEGRGAVERAVERLRRTRPTAVNLFWALDRMEAKARGTPEDELAGELLGEAREILREDVACNRAIGRLGAELLPPVCTLLTHCNAGALATGGHGTALGVIRSAREAGKALRVYACETRPLLQGARLTVWELLLDGFDVTLLCDSMAGSLMKRGGVHAVVVGADRIAANGDTANKIGTYGLAVLARHHGIPFYVAAPVSTIDAALSSGGEIPIEERSPEEVLRLPGGSLLPEEYTVWNPAFDVTDSRYITAIITERGVLRPPYGEAIAALFEGEE